MDAQFGPARTGRVDAQPAHAEGALDQVLLDMYSLDALEGDVDFLAHENAFVDVEFVVFDIEGEAPKMKHRSQHRQHSTCRHGPGEILRVLFLLHVRSDENRPRGAQHRLGLPSHQDEEADGVLAARYFKCKASFSHGFRLRASDGCCVLWPC